MIIRLALLLAIAVLSFGNAPRLASPAVAAPAAQETNAAQSTIYVVRYGDTLTGIAARYRTTVQAIMAANGLSNPNLIYVGQVLRLPSGTPPPPPPPPPGNPSYYVVQRGDTLISIAARFGTTVQAIMNANGIRNPNVIYVGQRLAIPGRVTTPPTPPPSRCTHIVQRGESLSSIGRLYNVNPYELARVNGIGYPYVIYVGQRLVVPGANCGAATATRVPATATGVAATATTVPATATGVAATATRVPATATTVSTAYPAPSTPTTIPSATTVPATATTVPTTVPTAYPAPATATTVPPTAVPPTATTVPATATTVPTAYPAPATATTTP